MTDGTAGGRRFLITVGVGTYTDGAIKDLPGVHRDVERVRALLEPMGYETVLPRLGADPSAQQLREEIGKWAAEAELGPADVVVLYFAGHGVKDLDRHYLLCSTSGVRDYDGTALASEDLGRSLVKSEVGQLLIILDTCYAGEGTGDIATLAAHLARFQRGAAGRWMLASARGKDRARENAFVDALTEVLERPRAGALQEFIGVREVTQRVNECFTAEGLAQHCRHSTIDSDGYAPFFRNKDHIPGLAGRGLDGETLNRLRKQTRGHFETRGRGVGSVDEKGDYFTGRTAVLDELTDWLAAPRHDGRARVVTGDPGSGKSAVLGRLLGRVADHHHVLQLHARHARLDDLVAVLAEAVHKPGTDLEALLQALAERDPTNPMTVLVDALDEAGAAGDAREGRLIAQRLLRPLSTLPAVRLIVGTRRSLLAGLGTAMEVIDLDDRVSDREIAEYARKLLLDTEDPHSTSPYRGRPDAAGTVARAIASRAGTSFLVTRMTARALVRETERIDTTSPGWEGRLPSSAEDAFEAYLKRFGQKRAAVEHMLRPLAYAQGAGLPWSTVWAPVAEALSGEPCSEGALRWLHEHAGSYVVETTTPEGDSAFRLFHESLAEYLRARGPSDEAAHTAISRTLLDQVQPDPEAGVADWAAVHPYLRDHLSTHAAAGGVLDALLRDPEYLVHAAPAHLVGVLESAVSPDCRQRAAVYRASFGAHCEAPPHERRDILAIDASRYGEAELSREFARGRGWRPRWATGGLINPALRSTLPGHPGFVQALDCTVIDGRPHVVTGFFSTVPTDLEVWDLTDETRRAVLSGHTATVRAVACTTVNGAPHAVSASDDGTLRVWNLVDPSEPLVCRVGRVTALACAALDGRPHVVVATDTSVDVWDLVDGTRRAELARAREGFATAAVISVDGRPHVVAPRRFSHRKGVRDLATGKPLRKWAAWRLRLRRAKVDVVTCTVIDGDPHAILCGHRTIQVWNLATGARRATLSAPDGFPKAAACTTVDGRPHVLVAFEKFIGVWDLIDGRRRAQLTGHTEAVDAVASATVDGRPHAVTGGSDGVRVWNLADATLQSARTGHTDPVRAVSCTTIGGRPHAVTGDDRGSLRVWKLAAEAPESTRSATLARWISASACIAVAGDPHTVIGSADGDVYVWNLARAGQPKRAAVSHSGWVRAVACTRIDGRPHGLSADDQAIRVWDLVNAAPRAEFSTPPGTVYALASTPLNGRPHAITGAIEGISALDLADGSERPEVFGGPIRGVFALACTHIDGHPHAVIAQYDEVHVRNLDDSALHTILDTGPAFDIAALTCTTIDGHPHAVLVLHAVLGTEADEFGARREETLQIWNLTTRQRVETIRLPLPVEAVAAHGSDIVLGMADEVVVLTRAQVRS